MSLDSRPLIRPFNGLRPRRADAAAVAAPPYDVLSSDEARVSWPGGIDGRPGDPSYDSMLAAHLAGVYATIRPPTEDEPTWLTAGPG